jgi:hypothetical protein
VGPAPAGVVGVLDPEGVVDDAAELDLGVVAPGIEQDVDIGGAEPDSAQFMAPSAAPAYRVDVATGEVVEGEVV